MVFLELQQNLGVFLSNGGDGPSKLMFVQRSQDTCLGVNDTSAYSSRLGRPIGMPLVVKHEIQAPFQVATVILGFLSIFKRLQDSSPFEALNSACLSKCQTDVRSPFKMRRGPRAFSRVSTGNQTTLHLVR